MIYDLRFKIYYTPTVIASDPELVEGERGNLTLRNNNKLLNKLR